MSLLDNMRQTLNDVTENVVEKSQNLSEQARLQVVMKKIQLERAKRLHELGNRTFNWYQTGNLVVGGQVPTDVTAICAELNTLQRQMEETQRQLEEAKLRAEQGTTDPNGQQVIVTVASPTPDTNIPPPGPGTTAPYSYPGPGAGTPPPPPTYTPPNVVDRSTTKLGDDPNAPTTGSGSYDPMVP
ncbi:MAG: hypothetical protein JO316_23805 [Abitibacteriaceae bacterium]|nr:hypothetical protein [Abditibacteriaceae bacterium]